MEQAFDIGAALGGHYRLGERLGQGGMGVVYRATDLRDQSTCALKVLASERSSPADIARFKREFRAATRLSHPACVRVLELGERDATWFFAMEYVPGGSLRPSRRTPQAAASIGLQILAALDHMHARQIVHRDIKPSNILLARDDAELTVVKVCDFGISKAADLTEDAAVGDLVGSLRYLAPEQADRGQADVRADLYALGVVLHELLTGRHPIPAPTQLPVSRRYYVDTPVNLAPDAPDLPAELLALVGQLLQKDPDHRPATAAEVHDRLRAWVDREAPGLRVPALPALARRPQLGAPRFVGRKDELARIRSFLSGAFSPGAQDTARLLMVSGPPGAGKSRLLDQALRIAETEGAVARVATCSAESGFAFSTLLALLQVHAQSPPDDLGPEESTAAARHVALPGSVLTTTASDSARDGATPSSQSSGPERDDGEQLDGAAERLRLQRAVADELLRASVRRPVLILLEDAQWADVATLQMLAFLLRVIHLAEERGDGPRIALIVSHRPIEGQGALTDLGDAAAASAALIRIEVRPLDQTDASQLVASVLMEPATPRLRDFAAAVRERTDGNPLFITEVLHALLAAGRLSRNERGWVLDPKILEGALLPTTVLDAIGDRAARFGIGTKRMLEAAAVVGRRFDLATLEATTGLDGAQLLDCLDEAIRGGFVEEEPGERTGAAGYRFTHDRFRESIYARLPGAEAAQLHLATAQALEQGPRARRQRAVDLAHHFERAHVPDKAYRYGLRAAEWSMKTFAFAEAAELYRRALAVAREAKIDVSSRVLGRQGEVCVEAGHYAQAERSFSERLRTLTDRAERAELLGRLADLEYRRGNLNRAEELLVEVVRETGHRVHRGLWLLLALVGQLVRFFVQLAVPGLRPRVQRGRAARTQLKIAFRSCARLAELCYYKNAPRALYFQLGSMEVAMRLGAGPHGLKAFAQQGLLLALYGFPGPSQRCFDQARASEKRSAPLDLSWGALMHALALSCEGRTTEALGEALRAQRALANILEPMIARTVLASRCHLLITAGEVEEGQALMRSFTRMAEEVQDNRSRGWAYHHNALLATLRGRGAEARELLRKSLAFLAQDGDRLVHLHAIVQLAYFDAEDGDPAALPTAAAAVDEYFRLGLRHPYGSVEGRFLAIAALHRLRGLPEPPQLDATVRKELRRGRFMSRSLRLLEPALLAGAAAWSVASRDLAAGTAGFAQAAALARQLGAQGDLHFVHALAARVLPGAEGEAHAREARTLEDPLANLRRAG